MATRKKLSKAGQPTSYDPLVHPREAHARLSAGSTKTGVAAAFGISYPTFLNWQEKHPEFFNAVKTGAFVMEETVVNSLYKAAAGYTDPDGKHYPPNPTSAIFLLKNINPNDWRDRKEVVADVKISELSEEEINARLMALINDS